MADERPAPYLAASGLTAGYGPTPTIVGVSASVARGEVACVIGPNGAGKSTFLKALVGILRITAGSVTIGGSDVTNLRTDELARRGIGYVPQVHDVFDPLTVRENLEMGGYLLPAAEVGLRLTAVIEVFPALGEMLGRRALKLSGGERKMLAIGRVLMLAPAVLVLDEPTANLAPKLATILLRDHVRRLADAGSAVLLVEQRASAALEISDHAYVMVAGAVALEDRASTLLGRRDVGELFLGHAPVSTEVSEGEGGATNAPY